MLLDPAKMRHDYDAEKLEEQDAAPDPLAQFSRWFEEAVSSDKVHEPNAVALATANTDGLPSCRMVLMKGYDSRGFVVYTNLESRKSEELKANPKASLLFWWDRLYRQVRIEGKVEQASAEEADAYFATRPHGSRVGAIASPQSKPITRQDLEAKVESLSNQHPEGSEVPRPAHWGGWRLKPVRFEFWQGRKSRLHDRLVYERDGENWKMSRIAP